MMELKAERGAFLMINFGIIGTNWDHSAISWRLPKLLRAVPVNRSHSRHQDTATEFSQKNGGTDLYQPWWFLYRGLSVRSTLLHRIVCILNRRNKRFKLVKYHCWKASFWKSGADGTHSRTVEAASQLRYFEAARNIHTQTSMRLNSS